MSMSLVAIQIIVVSLYTLHFTKRLFPYIFLVWVSYTWGMPSTSYSRWPLTMPRGGLFVYMWLDQKVSTLIDFNDETWDVGCTLIFGGNSNLNMFLYICSKMKTQVPILDVDFGVRPMGKVKFFKFNNIILAHLILHFIFGIDLLYIAFSSFLHHQVDHHQNMFMLLGQIHTILVEL